LVQYYWNPAYPQGMQPQQQQMVPQQMTPPQIPAGGRPSQPPAGEESYIENILRLNKGKLATVYLTFENNREWNAKVIKGIVETAGRDHLIVSEPATGKRYLIPLIYLDYVTFDEEINYF
jgi:spore germination protein Q